MWEAAVVEDAIQAHPQAAEAALAQVRLTFETVPDIHGLRAAADYLELPLHEVWAQTLERKDALDAFAAALSAQGVSLGDQVLAFDDTHWDIRRTPEFFSRAEVFRCRVLADGAPTGSGILVGPSTVLTAWHVVAAAAPDEPQEPARRVQVEVAGGRRIEAAAPWRFESYCGSLEYQKRLPKTDAEVDNRHDLALLSLREPVGLHSGFATLPPQPYDYHGPAAMAVVHFPEGEDHGIGMGRLRKLPGLTARWGHDVQTAGGSSGGGCFDTRYQLIGVHQGRAGRGGRLVPAVRFPAAVIQAIAEDEAPPTLWSLDGTLGTSLVVGRDMLFQAYAAARRDGRARGLWVKRIDTVNDVSGL
ncbi:MAG TPA: serine protease, partial [Phenylobacterium sp.]|nr:serine protease [Phenylobacterium sp.]